MLTRGILREHIRELDRRIQDIGGQDNFHGDLYKDCKELMEREIPKIPKRITLQRNWTEYRCPSCGKLLNYIHKDVNHKDLKSRVGNYCKFCGKRIEVV